MKRHRCAPLLLLLFVTGCHVVERAEHCGQLSAIAKKAAQEITATTIPESPTLAVLRKKAQLYGALAENLEKVGVRDQAVKNAQGSLILSLENLARHLLEAAQTVEAQKAFLERQSRAAARHEETMALKKAEAEKRAKESGEKSTISPPAPTVRENPSAEASPRQRGRELPGLGALAGESGRAKNPALPYSAPHSPHLYGYERVKRAVEATSRAVESARRDLENACR